MADKNRTISFEELVGEMMNCMKHPGPTANICPKCNQPAAIWIVGFEGCGGCFIRSQHEGEPIQ